MTEALIGVAVVLSLNMLAYAFTYGRLTNKVNNLCDIVNNHLRGDIKGIHKRLDGIDERLSRLEGYLNKEEK